MDKEKYKPKTLLIGGWGLGKKEIRLAPVTNPAYHRTNPHPPTHNWVKNFWMTNYWMTNLMDDGYYMLHPETPPPHPPTLRGMIT